MDRPLATYRLQFSPEFRFEDARRVLPYLARLGASDVYASPIFRATPGSTHGYDVTDPNELNPELGGAEAFAELTAQRRRLGLGWLQDIVPNHMAYSPGNALLMDVLEKGGQSWYLPFFDIMWDHPDPRLRGRVLAPFLGKPLDEALRDREVTLARDEEGLYVRYYDWRMPLNAAGRAHVLAQAGQIAPGLAAEDRDLDAAVEYFNTPGNGDGLPPLAGLLNSQHYCLAYWKTAAKLINYRRFFYINGFVGVQVEHKKVREFTHRLIFDQCREGGFTGLRVDHIDGMLQPGSYLDWLRERSGGLYLVVEKILEPDEPLPSDWACEGTSGYEFCNQLTGVLCDHANRDAFTRIYHDFLGRQVDYGELFYRSKRRIVAEYLGGELGMLAHWLDKVAAPNRPTGGAEVSLPGKDPADPPPGYELQAPNPICEKRIAALLEVIAAFPVYRTYVDAGRASPTCREYLDHACSLARRRRPDLAATIGWVREILTAEFDEDRTPSGRERCRSFTLRFQQYTGPAMAKGFEDTLLYIYNRLTSLNEVGGDPNAFGITLEKFHELNARRGEQWPFALSATSTHDTKRSEDVRARINVISEMPETWGRRVQAWARVNRPLKREVDGEPAPSADDEYLLYQTLVGAWPLEESEWADFPDRIQAYMLKALREAKIHTNWEEPDESYEAATGAFVSALVEAARERLTGSAGSAGGGEDDPTEVDFVPDFVLLASEIAHFGMLNGISQVLLKLFSPGIPDFYQGCELWDLSLVDPDNRRPVDYEKRAKLLQECCERAENDRPGYLAEVLENWRDGRVKLFVTWQGLALRRAHRELFERGDYQPIQARGEWSRHVVAFGRNLQTAAGERLSAIIVVPRLMRSLVGPGELPLGETAWGDTRLELPGEAGGDWHEALTGEKVALRPEMPVADILRSFPGAVLLRH